MNKKVLVLGNGFDLAHGLPTSYSNFIEFISLLDDDKSGDEISEYLQKNSNCDFYDISKIDALALKQEYKDKVFSLSEKGILNYLKLTKNLEKWVDFENEIFNLLKTFQMFNDISEAKAIKKKVNIYVISSNYKELSGDEIRKYNMCLEKISVFTPIYNEDDFNEDYKLAYLELNTKKIFETLSIAINELENLFNWYIVKVINKILSTKFSHLKNEIVYNVDHVINFNYTDTLHEMYHEIHSENSQHFIHGQASISDNNILFGCNYNNEFDTKELRVFSKKFKRIFYNTKYIAVRAVEDNLRGAISENIDPEYNSFYNPKFEYSGVISLYFWGHSLSSSDSDNIQSIFNMIKNLENLHAVANIIILYHNEQSKFDMLNNLFDIFGQDYIEEYTNSNRLCFEESAHYTIEKIY